MLGQSEWATNRKVFASLVEDILVQAPGAAVASDQPCREADLAVDFREDVEPLDHAEIDKIVAMM